MQLMATSACHVYLFLPKKASPPFQAVVHFPGAAALYEHSSENLQGFIEDFAFIIKSGRAVIFPAYKGTFDRWDNFLALYFELLQRSRYLLVQGP